MNAHIASHRRYVAKHLERHARSLFRMNVCKSPTRLKRIRPEDLEILETCRQLGLTLMRTAKQMRRGTSR